MRLWDVLHAPIMGKISAPAEKRALESKEILEIRWKTPMGVRG